MSKKRKPDALEEWLSLTWEKPERSYNPNLRDFLAAILGYPKQRVQTEDAAGTGYPDLILLSRDSVPWVVGDLRKDDAQLTDDSLREALWQEKKKYVSGSTRYVLFLTPHYFWVVLPSGEPVADVTLAGPVDLRDFGNATELAGCLSFISYEQSEHQHLWDSFVAGEFPYCYLTLNHPDAVKQLKADLQDSFEELLREATAAFHLLESSFEDFVKREGTLERDLAPVSEDTYRRAHAALLAVHQTDSQVFQEDLPWFEEHYGRDVSGSSAQREARTREAFLADSITTLIARVLFLRLVEDLGQTKKRRLSNGGPANWAQFVESLHDDAQELVRVASKDVARSFSKPFERTVFDWVSDVNSAVNTALQRLVIRTNAYDFSTLDEEVLGSIYQEFLPTPKRKALGEYYTPRSVVDWIIENTAVVHGAGKVLDPGCGSGSFLVAYANWRIGDARHRGLDLAQLKDELLDEVWGFDINPFASFISHFQLLWSLLRLPGNVEGGRINTFNINSLLRAEPIRVEMDLLIPGEVARDEKKWKYVLGNPPYIRAERVKYGEEIKELWKTIWGQNSDTGLIFIWRALTEWLEEAGLFGMVVSGGYANSQAAAPVWQALQPGGVCALRKVVWLEFARDGKGRLGKIWDASRVPMILIIEKKEPEPGDAIELFVPSSWPGTEGVVSVDYSDFFNQDVNPDMLRTPQGHGTYLLPLLKPDDIPILRALSPRDVGSPATLVDRHRTLGSLIDWTYGIQRGGVDATEAPTGKRSVEIVAGRSVGVAWTGSSSGWVDLDAVSKRPYGKLSLWKDGHDPAHVVLVPEIACALTAAVGSGIAAVNTLVVGEAESESQAKAVAACLNSSLLRFQWATKLRTGVIEGTYSHFYPRVLASLPWPREAGAAELSELAGDYEELAELAVSASAHPVTQLLGRAQELIEQGKSMRASDPTLALDFKGWSDCHIEDLYRTGRTLSSGLFGLELADAEMAEYVEVLLLSSSTQSAVVSAKMLQKILIPSAYAELIQQYHVAAEEFSEVKGRFIERLLALDSHVYELYAVSGKDQKHIAGRLAEFPLNELAPRFPWDVRTPQPLKAYTEDRFA